MTVARLAPFTPMLNTKINNGSRAMLVSAPISTDIIAVSEYPCVVINGFNPCANITKSVPHAYMRR